MQYMGLGVLLKASVLRKGDFVPNMFDDKWYKLSSQEIKTGAILRLLYYVFIDYLPTRV